MKRVWSVAEWLLTVVFTSLIVLTVYAVVEAKIYHSDFPLLSRYRLMTVLSGSMTGTFNTGSVVVVEKTDPDTLQPGAIITFRNPAKPSMIVSHRIVGIRNGMLITKGDANNVADPVPVPKQDVIGKVVWHVPDLGYIFHFTSQKTGFVLLLILPGLFLFASGLWSIFRALQAE
jgi:signal peptidase